MLKEPEVPTEVLLTTFFDSVAGIVILVGMLRIAYFWHRKKYPLLTV
jgi:hypothetical protein